MSSSMKSRGGARERLAAARAAEAEAFQRAQEKVEAQKIANRIAAEESAATSLGEKRRARELLGLKGYWRPSSIYVSDSRYAQDFEIMVNVPACSAVKDRAKWKLNSSTSGTWVEGEGEAMFWFGATLFDKDGELCYTYQRMSELPKTDTSGGIQLAVPIDEAQLFRLRMRERIKAWGRLLNFREHCFALVELANMIRDKTALDEANRKLAIEAARVERERLARERQPGALPKDYKEGFELGAMKELARLALQLHRGPITNSEAPRYLLPRNAGEAVAGPLYHSSLPAQREPPNLDRLDEPNLLSLHPLGDKADHSKAKADQTSYSQLGSDIVTESWDLKELLFEFPELQGVLRQVLGGVSTPRMAEMIKLPDTLEQSRLDALPEPPPEWKAAGKVLDGSEYTEWDGESSDDDSETSDNYDGSYRSYPIPPNQTIGSELHESADEARALVGTSDTSWPSQSQRAGSPSFDHRPTSPQKHSTEKSDEFDEEQFAVHTTPLKEVGQSSREVEEDSVEDNKETEKTNDEPKESFDLKLPPVSVTLPFMAEDFPYGECTLYMIGSNTQEQIADLDQVVGANLAALKVEELNREREEHEAAKAAKIERGENVSDSEDEYDEYMRRQQEGSSSDEDDIYIPGEKPGVKRYVTPKKLTRKASVEESYSSYQQYQQMQKGGSSARVKTPPSSRIVFTPQLLSTPQRLGQRRARKPVTPGGGNKASEEERKSMLEEYQRLRRPPSYSSLASRSAKLGSLQDLHDSSKDTFASAMPSINSSSHAAPAAYSANMHSAYDPLSWKGRLVVKAGGREARAWFKISRPLARPADPYPLQHEDYDYSHARERIVCSAIGRTMSAAITRQGRLYTWGDNSHGQLGRREEGALDNSDFQSLQDQSLFSLDDTSTHSSSTATFSASLNGSVSPGSSYVDQHLAIDYSEPVHTFHSSSRAASRSRKHAERNDFESLSMSKESGLLVAEDGSKVSGTFDESSKPSVMFADLPSNTEEKQWDELEQTPHSLQSNSFVGDFTQKSTLDISLELGGVSIGASKGIERLGLDGGGLPLRAGLGRVLCSLGPHQRFVMVSCGASHTVALTSLGRLYTFGSNHLGQLGLDRTPTHFTLDSDTSRPQLVSSMLNRTVVWCGAGDNFTACIALDNQKEKLGGTICQRVYTCGANDCGQLGLGGTFTQERVNGTGGYDVNGYDTTMGNTCVRAFRAVVIQPMLPPVVTPLHARDHFSAEEHKAYLENKFNQPTKVPETEIEGGTGAVPRSMSCGGRHCALVTMDGRLITWGANDFGQLGRGFFSDDISAPDGGAPSTADNHVKQQQADIKIAETVKRHRLKVASHGKMLTEEDVASLTRRAKAGEHIDRVKTPETPKPGRRSRFKAAVNAVMAVEKMTNAAAALDAASARREQAGKNTGRPSEVEFADITAARDGDASKGIVRGGEDAVAERAILTVACGADHTIVARKDRTVWACGRNHRGQLGIGKISGGENAPAVWVDKTFSFKEVTALHGLGTVSVSAGYSHTLAVTATETCYQWGSVSNDPLKVTPTPQVVPLLSGRQPTLHQPSGSAQHAMVKTFDVIGPLLIVFDILAAKESFIPKQPKVELPEPNSKFSAVPSKEEEGEIMSEEEKRVKESADYLLDWRYIGRCVSEGKWNSSGSLLWLKHEGLYWDATKRPPPVDPTTALPDASSQNKAKHVRDNKSKQHFQDSVMFNSIGSSSALLNDIQPLSASDELLSPLVNDEEDELTKEELKKTTSGSVRLVVNKYIQDQLLAIISERLKEPDIRDSEDVAMIALSTHAVALTKAENSTGDMSSHTKQSSHVLLKAKNKVAEKRRLEKLEEALKDGFVWDGPKLPRTPKYEFTEFMDSPILPLEEVDARADSLADFQHRMSSPGTPVLTSRSSAVKSAGRKRSGVDSGQGSRVGSATPGSAGVSRKSSFVEELENEPLSAVSGKWSNSSVGSSPPVREGGGTSASGIDADLEAFSNAALDAMRDVGCDLRKKEEPLSPGSPLSPSLPMLSRKLSRKQSSRSSRAMEAMIAQEEELNRKKEISDGATIGGAMLWSKMASAPRRVVIVTASADNIEDGEEGARRLKAYKKLGLGACTVSELKAVMTTLVKETPGEELPDPKLDFGDLSGHDVQIGQEESKSEASGLKTPNLSRSPSSNHSYHGTPGPTRTTTRSGRDSLSASRQNTRNGGSSSGRLSAGWHRSSRRSARPPSSIAGSETATSIGDERTVDIDTAMFCSSAIRKGLALVGTWTIDGKPQPLPPSLPSAMQACVDRMMARKNSEGSTPAEGEYPASHSASSSRPSTPGTPIPSLPSLGMIPSSNKFSFADLDHSEGESSVNPSIDSQSRHDAVYQEGVHSILPTIVDGDSWFCDEDSALDKLRGVVPMVYDWAARTQEDGYPVPTIVEELVEKNGLAAALNHGWWQFVGEFIYLTAMVPRWRAVVAMQLQAARVRLHADVRGTGETRAGGFLLDPRTDQSVVSPVGVSLSSLNLNGSIDSESVDSIHPTEAKTDEELWDCFCGTCAGCVMIAAKKVPERLFSAYNNSLGPDRAKELKELDQRQHRSEYLSQCTKLLVKTCTQILKLNPLFSDDQVRREILRGDNETLLQFHRDYPEAFAAFSDRRTSAH